jgi:hypothetical protein
MYLIAVAQGRREIMPGSLNFAGPFNFVGMRNQPATYLFTILRYKGKSLQILTVGQVFSEAGVFECHMSTSTF